MLERLHTELALTILHIGTRENIVSVGPVTMSSECQEAALVDCSGTSLTTVLLSECFIH